MFNWLTRKVYEAMAEGARRFFAEVNPEAPPQTIAEMKAMVAEPPPALPAGDEQQPQPEEPATSRAKKGR